MFGFNPVRRIANGIRRHLEWDASYAWMHSHDYAARHGATWHKVADRTPAVRPRPQVFGDETVDIQRRLDGFFPEAGVLDLQGALLYDRAGWVFSREGHLLPDHSWYTQHVDEIAAVPRRPPVARRLEGTTLSLASDFGVGSFGHFMLDCISRIDLFRRAGFSLADVDHVYSPKPATGGSRRLLAHFGIPEHKMVWADDFAASALPTERLLAPTFPGTRRNYPPWLPAFFQNELLDAKPERHRRLYISRQGFRRNATNEEAVLDILRRRGFEVYQPGSTPHPHRDFAQAEVIVGAHGGSLSELVYCQPGTRVVELVPSDHVFPYYYSLALATGLDYACIGCPSETQRAADATGPSLADFYVDPEALDAALVHAGV
jgi:capsular polysaccharide biosynthesis protein